jgi:hypothetical protein
MTYRGMLELAAVAMVAALTVAATPRDTAAGPGEAGGVRRPAAGRGAARADFVVLIWYRRADALGTFQYQTYDVRKDEYTGAVDDWIKLMREKHPAYLVRVRAVDLRRERGETETLKVGSVIYRELLIAAAESGVVLGAPMQIGPGPYAAQRPSSRARVWTETPGAGGIRDLNPVGGTSPFPFPYMRPRPP